MADVLLVDGAVRLWPAAAVAVAAVLIGFASGGLPGVASLAAPVLTLAVPFEQAQAVVLPMFLFGQLAGTIAHWKQIHWRELESLVGLAAIGILTGWWIWELMLGHPEFPTFRLYLKGATACIILALAYSLYRTRIREPALPSPQLGRKTSMAWCVLAGMLSTIANVSGSLVVWYLSTRNLKKEQLTATIAAGYLIINALKIIPYTALGFYDLSQVSALGRSDIPVWTPVFLLLFAAMLFGRWRLQRTTQKRFNIAIVTVMTTVAVGILWQVTPEIVRGLLAPFSG